MTVLAAAPLLSNTVWYTYTIMALPALLGSDGKRPPPQPVGSTRVRLVGWLLIQVPTGVLSLLGVGLTVAAGLVQLMNPRTRSRPGSSITDHPMWISGATGHRTGAVPDEPPGAVAELARVLEADWLLLLDGRGRYPGAMASASPACFEPVALGIADARLWRIDRDCAP